MAFPETGAYVVPGALVPVEIDRERDEGLYVASARFPSGWCGRSMRSVKGEHRREDDHDRGGPEGEDGKVGGLPALEPVESRASA